MDAIIALIAAALAVCSCDGAPTSDRAERMRQAGSLSAVTRHKPPELPLDQRTGCEVCPSLCRFYPLPRMPPEPIIAAFRAAVAEWSATQHLGNPSNRDEINRAVCIVLRSGEPAEAAFLALLDDDDEAVRYMAAYQAINVGMANAGPAAVLYDMHIRDTPYALYAYYRWKLWREMGDMDPSKLSDLHRKNRFGRP